MLPLSKILIAVFVFIAPLTESGFADPGPCDGKDPYQSIQYTNVLKSRLLRRIANDPAHVNDPVFGEVTADPCTSSAAQLSWPFNENVLKTRNADLSSKNYPQGSTLTTSNEAEIEALFVNVANRIKLKLIS